MVTLRNKRRPPKIARRFASGDIDPRTLPKEEQGGVDFVSTRGTVRQLEHIGDLKGRKGAETLRRMVDTDPNCQAALNALMLPLTAVEWRVQPASDDARDVELAEKCEEALFGMRHKTWHSWLEEALETVLVVGYATHEPVWERGELADLASRPPETIVDMLVDENGRFRGVEQTLGYATRVELLKENGQCLHLVRRVRGGDFYGRSAFRAAYRPHIIGRELEEISNIAVERAGVGIPVAQVKDGDSGDPRIAILRTALSKLYTRESVALALPHWAEFLGFKGAGGGTIDPKPLIDRADGLVLRALGVEFLALGMDGGGSLALRRDASSEFVASLRAHARLITEPINCDLMPWLVLSVAGRGVERERWPTLEHGSLDVRNVPEISQSLAALKSSGVIGKFTDEDETFVRDLISLPDRDYSEDVGDERDPPPPPQFGPPTDGDEPEDEEEPPEEEEEASDEEQVNAGRSFRFSDAGGDGFTSWREPRGAERFVCFGKIERQLDDAVEGLSAALLEIRAQQVDALVARAEDLFTDPDAKPGDIVNVEVPFASRMEEAALPFLRQLYDEGRSDVIAETRAQVTAQRLALELDRPEPTDAEEVEGFLRASARIIASVLSGKLLESFQHIVRDTLGLGEARLPTLREGLQGLSEASVVREARLSTSEAMNIGRGAGLEQAEDQFSHFILTELLDTNTCGPCRQLDGEEYASLPDIYAGGRYPPQSVCEGGNQCRGIVVGVARDEISRAG